MDRICIQESNLNISSCFRIPGFSALRSDCIHSRFVIFSTDTTHASGDVIIFVRQGLSFCEFSTLLFLRLIPTQIMSRLTSLYTTSPRSHSLVSIRSSPTDSRTDSFSPSIFSPGEVSSFWGDFNCHHPVRDSKGTPDSGGEEVFNWIISSDLLPLNDWHTYSSPSLLLWLLFPWHLFCSLLSCPFLLLTGTSWLGFWSPSNSTNCPSFSGLFPQWASPLLEFWKSSSGWLWFLL